MIHISQLSEARVEKVEDVVKVGDQVTVRVREIDNRERINLTLRGVPQNGGMNNYPLANQTKPKIIKTKIACLPPEELPPGKNFLIFS